MVLLTLFGFGERNLLERITRNRNSRIKNKYFHITIRKKNGRFKIKKIDCFINDIKNVIREIYRNFSKKILLFFIQLFSNF